MRNDTVDQHFRAVFDEQLGAIEQFGAIEYAPLDLDEVLDSPADFEMRELVASALVSGWSQ